MSHGQQTFFTSIGCMDGRAQEPIAKFGRERFGAQYPDTITEAGLDGLLANETDQTFIEALKKKVLISIEKHHSRGIVVHGHEDCAGNPVDYETHIQNIKASVEKIKELFEGRNIKIVGVFVKLHPQLEVQELEKSSK